MTHPAGRISLGEKLCTTNEAFFGVGDLVFVPDYIDYCADFGGRKGIARLVAGGAQFEQQFEHWVNASTHLLTERRIAVCVAGGRRVAVRIDKVEFISAGTHYPDRRPDPGPPLRIAVTGPIVQVAA